MSNQEKHHNNGNESTAFMHKFNKLTNSVLAVWGFVAFIVSSTIAGYTWYTTILDSIGENTSQIEKTQGKIEVTQMMILKNIVRESEKNPCPVSDSEWDDYTKNYTLLFNLQIKHGEIHKNAQWKPIERITEGSDICQN